MPIASALLLRRLRIGAAAAMFLAAVTPALAEEAPAVALLAPAPDTEVIGKRLGEVVLGAGRAVGAVDIGRRAVAGDNAQLAEIKDLVEYRRPRGARAQQGRQRDVEE